MKWMGWGGFLILAACAGRDATPATEAERWAEHAANVTITRDDWGIPHIHGKTDADAVFGLMYAQAEDDFNRIETNFLNALGRMAEAEGDSVLFRDLRMRLFIHPDTLKALYDASPAWLQSLMSAWADGLNYYLQTHPAVTPRVLTRFEPWMALSFSEGSIGGDIESIRLAGLRAFYGDSTPAEPDPDGGDGDPGGSNGIAIAPALTSAKHALLLINPHTSFFFRAEVQVSSDEGLNAYGAVTWGQFFVYQGFNETAGWMHTSSNVDNIDEYRETILRKPEGVFYRVGAEERPIVTDTVTLQVRSGAGLVPRRLPVYRTHRGPIIRDDSGKWVSVRLMHDPVRALTQSYTRTKARNYREFRATMELRTNSSNNTLFADAEGNIAYLHANFIPRRDTSFDWSKPVDGSNPATEWQDLYAFEEAPNVVNPANGWVYNTNNWPYSAAGAHSPKALDFPRYVDDGQENARGLHAIRLLDGKTDFTLESLLAAAYDSYLTAFEPLLPAFLSAYDGMPAADPVKARLAEPVDVLRGWDLRWSAGSEATTLGIAWGSALSRRLSRPGQAARCIDVSQAAQAPGAAMVAALSDAVAKLTADYGRWRIPWGDINRFQRLTADIVHPFNDTLPSIPVAFTSACWGSLASFSARQQRGTKKLYGTSGNSFVAVVEFGDRVRARAVTAGGQSGNPASPHFNDQAARYSTGDLREVYFYPEQLSGHTERKYRPGEQ